MSVIDSMLDFMSKKVQNFTGETERRELVDKIKETYEKGKEEIQKLIDKINSIIKVFNDKILILNDIRENRLNGSIKKLSVFLSNFGNVKDMTAFTKEKEKNFISIPNRTFQHIENYIDDIDWSSEKIFYNTLKSGGPFAAITTRRTNINMKQKLEILKCLMMDANDKIRNNIEMLETVDIKICDIYINVVNKVCDYITNVIEPELDMIMSFLECNSIKNAYIMNTNATEIKNVYYQKDIFLYNNTIYQKHYNFVKNTFWFYILASTIYSSPILSKLLDKKELTNEDLNYLQQQNDLCENQIKILNLNRGL